MVRACRVCQGQLEFMFMKHYAPNRCEPSIEVIMKMGVQWGGGGCWVLGGCQGIRGGGGGGGVECERRFEVFVKCNYSGG